jgi:apolipoprotein N-acyltransferase
MPLLISLLLGLIAACGFAPLGLWPLTLLGMAGLMWLVSRAATLRRALALGWYFGLGHFVAGLNWIATAFTYQDAMPAWLGWIAVVLLSLYLAVYPALTAGLAWRRGLLPPPLAGEGRGEGTTGRPGAAAPEEEGPLPTLSGKRERVSVAFVLIFAAAWMVTEWLRATMFTGFAWNPLGVALVDTPLSRTTAWIGTYGLSALLVLIAGGLMLAVERRWWQALPLLGFGTATLLACVLIPTPDSSARGPLIRIVQPNIGQQDKWEPQFRRRNFARLAYLTGPPTAEPRLIFWPEAAVPDYLEEEPLARARIARLLGPKDVLLTGGVALEYGRGGQLLAARNSLFAMDAAGRLLGRYDKAHLVPYGEYLPMRPILSAIGLSRLAPGDLDFWPGPAAATLTLPGFGRMGVQICYEIIFSGHVVDRRNRPDFLFNPSNDAWFGAWGPPQHLAQARLRAIEEGLPVIRSTPTGISAVIDAEGRLISQLPWRTAGSIAARLPARQPPTPFARYGNILPFLFAALLALVAIALRRRAR